MQLGGKGVVFVPDSEYVWAAAKKISSRSGAYIVICIPVIGPTGSREDPYVTVGLAFSKGHIGTIGGRNA